MGALALASAAACAPVLNYTDPAGPRHSGGEGLPAASEAGAIRVVSYNIAYGREPEKAAACLGVPPLLGADVVLLQEMNAYATETMATALGMHFVYYPSSHRDGQPDMGESILSPWPIEATEKLVLPHTSHVLHRGRSATIATIRIEGVAVRIYSLHLGSPFGQTGGQRGDQAEAVIADARRWDGPTIIGGDLNSRSVSLRFEAAGFRWLTKSVGRTVGIFSFDHVFVRGLGATDGVGVGTCPGASDHSPVWALVRP
jgi:endonuclease/exonuclease/phosphatase family metal-dependent hydrolase